MIRCFTCSFSNVDGARFCSGCGKDLGMASSPTRTVAAAVAPARDRVVTGTLLAGRYEILALAGTGGMGEVYQAHDRKLNQIVALKFLPHAMRLNPAALARLHNEVRLARQVSHPNVCRVYDIAEAEGLHFLTMEFVDGENLAHLLKRIGRFPPDKGIEVARQVCAAVAAAHRCGVLHRDLKPANVMLDSAGQVIVTDFGLAAVAGEVREGDVASGTPAYMSPEQLERRAVTVRSDIFSLGLVLYEIFTGKRAFDGTDRVTASRPSSVVADLDPAIERVILRCLEPDPRDRPASALSVAAALPGGDPLEAALAAGETPSPDLIAASGREYGLSVRAAWLCIIAALACLAAAAALRSVASIDNSVPVELAPDVLVAKARDIASAVGYAARPRDTAYGFVFNTGYLAQLRTKAEWQRLGDRRPTAAIFWYRESPWVLGPIGPDTVSVDDPPLTIPGMISVEMDTAGRLMWFEAVPPVREDSQESREPDWTALFKAAGLDPDRFERTAPEWLPLVSSDLRRAWRGAYPGQDASPLRIEAASWAGKPVYFRLIEPWVDTAPGQAPSWEDPYGKAIAIALYLAAGWLAWKNVRTGRGDRRGAFRVGVCMAVLRVVFLAANGEFDHYLVLGRRYVWKSFGDVLFFGVVGWAAYMALEPLIRRKWPQSLVSWSRILAGRPADPLVGSDVLIGVTGGCAATALTSLTAIVAVATSGTRVIPTNFRLPYAAVPFIGEVASNIAFVVMWSLLETVLLILIWMLVRSKWLAAAIMGVLLFAFWVPFLAAPGFRMTYLLVYALPIAIVNIGLLARFGVTTFAAAFLTDALLSLYGVGLDFSAWCQNFGRAAAALVIVMGLYAFRTALGGRTGLGGTVFSERG